MLVFTSEFSSFAFVIGRTTFFSLVSFHRSRFVLANAFYVSFLRNLFFLFSWGDFSIYEVKKNHKRKKWYKPWNCLSCAVWWLGGKRGAGVRGTGSRGTGYGVRGLVENAGSGGKRGEPFFSPKYEFSSVKWGARILLAYIAMNINSASRPETRCLIKRAN